MPSGHLPPEFTGANFGANVVGNPTTPGLYGVHLGGNIGEVLNLQYLYALPTGSSFQSDGITSGYRSWGMRRRTLHDGTLWILLPTETLQEFLQEVADDPVAALEHLADNDIWVPVDEGSNSAGYISKTPDQMRALRASAGLRPTQSYRVTQRVGEDGRLDDVVVRAATEEDLLEGDGTAFTLSASGETIVGKFGLGSSGPGTFTPSDGAGIVEIDFSGQLGSNLVRNTWYRVNVRPTSTYSLLVQTDNRGEVIARSAQELQPSGPAPGIWNRNTDAFVANAAPTPPGGTNATSIQSKPVTAPTSFFSGMTLRANATNGALEFVYLQLADIQGLVAALAAKPSLGEVNTAINDKLNGLAWKENVRILTNLSGTSCPLTYPYSGPATLQGVTLVDGDDVAINNGAYTGIWTVNTVGTWSRHFNAATIGGLKGATFMVDEGDYAIDPGTLQRRKFSSTFPVGGTLNTTSFAFTETTAGGATLGNQSEINSGSSSKGVSGETLIGHLQGGGSTGFWTLPGGTTAQRPSTVAPGQIRYNTDTLHLELYDGGWRSLAKLSGATFTGPVTVPAPSSNSHAATKLYVDETQKQNTLQLAFNQFSTFHRAPFFDTKIILLSERYQTAGIAQLGYRVVKNASTELSQYAAGAYDTLTAANAKIAALTSTEVAAGFELVVQAMKTTPAYTKGMIAGQSYAGAIIKYSLY